MAGRPQAIFRFAQLNSLSQEILARACLVCLLGGLGTMLAGCSMSFPISPLMSPASSEDTTGAIPKSPLANLLDAEDWRRAKAALSTALDPQGNGALVTWDNPDSGHKGSFRPVGKAYPSDSGICRVFLAEIDRKGEAQAIQGTACSDRQGQWTIAEAKPWKKI